MVKIWKNNKCLYLKQNSYILTIEPWGKNSLRVQMQKQGIKDRRNWALMESEKELGLDECVLSVMETDYKEPWTEGKGRKIQTAEIRNGKMIARINQEGWITFWNEKGEILLRECWRNRDRIDRYAVPLNLPARQMKPILGSDSYQLTMRFEADEKEHIYGMGQYQEEGVDRKGCILELAQRNTQASVPFYISSKGYGFLWNNPAVGQVVFGKNATVWTAERTRKLDYYITCGDSPKELLEQYTAATGRPPHMPSWALGLWQSKLRYRTQDEVMHVVERYRQEKLPLDIIIIDFFHWAHQGEFRFDPKAWPDPVEMIKELKKDGVKVMVSVWPTVDSGADTYDRIQREGYLVEDDRGSGIHMNWMGETKFLDFSSGEASRFVWEQCRKNYFAKGIEMFWLDEAEPEYPTYDFDLYRYQAGSALEVGNYYPVWYGKAFYDGMKREGKEEIVNLIRCAWAGSQKLGVVVWSGDVHSSFEAMRIQMQAGLSMGISGIAWWCSDIGGFLGGQPEKKEFRELLIRWFQWSVFSPILRLHGARQPFIKLEASIVDGVRQFTSGQDNELWSYGKETFVILKKYLKLREKLKKYLEQLMEEAHRTGIPLMRTMFFEFPDEKRCWEIEDQYMFGKDILVAPILEQGQIQRTVYLPKETDWFDCMTGEFQKGGQKIAKEVPIDKIAVFIRKGANILFRI